MIFSAPGYDHFQCTFGFKTNKTLAQVKELIGEATAHCEVCVDVVGSCKYCQKDGNWIAVGDLPKKGRGERRDLSDFVDRAKVETDELKMFEEYPTAMVHYPKAYTRIRQLVQAKAAASLTYEKPTVIWVHGATGTGKSRGAREQFPGIYSVPLSEKKVWFGPDYTGQKAILLDDFNGQWSYHDLKRICDGYAMEVEVKGGFVQRQWNTVVITSTRTLDQCYPDIQILDEMRRRITRVVELPEDMETWCPSLYAEITPVRRVVDLATQMTAPERRRDPDDDLFRMVGQAPRFGTGLFDDF